MADTFEASSAPDKSAATVPVVPPSTSEVSVRTMASDIELMGKSGGMAGQGMSFGQVQHVPVSSEPQVAMSSTGVEAPHGTPADRSGPRPLMLALIIIVSAAILFAAGFYLYPLFAGQ